MGTDTGTRTHPQVIRIVGHDGEVTEFVGDHFSLLAGPLGQRIIVDDNRRGPAGCVWSEPCPRNLVRVDVTITHPRPDFQLGGTMHPAVPEEGIPERLSPSPTRVIPSTTDGM